MDSLGRLKRNVSRTPVNLVAKNLFEKFNKPIKEVETASSEAKKDAQAEEEPEEETWGGGLRKPTACWFMYYFLNFSCRPSGGKCVEMSRLPLDCCRFDHDALPRYTILDQSAEGAI